LSSPRTPPGGPPPGPPPDPRSDAELVAACRRGDDDAFAVLYRRYRDWVVAVGYRFCGNREDALDALQETFAYLVRKLPTLELTGKLTTLLYPAAKHLALDRGKKTRRLRPIPEEVDPADPAPLAGVPDGARALLEGLPPAQQEILGLRYVDGLDLKDIAAVLRIPVGTVKSRLHHALRALREKLGENE